MTTRCQEADLERNLRWVREAKQMSDWVLYSFHTCYHGVDGDDPPAHAKQLAHGVIDAGADVFIGHGVHRDRGIEIYSGKPIFYGLGNFILQNDTVLRQPADAYARYQLGPESTPGDFYWARSGGETRGQDVSVPEWQSVVAMVKWRGHSLAEIELYPIDLGMGRPIGQRGRPLRASGEVADQALKRVARMSEAFDTIIELRDGTAHIVL
jgi:poly-gamma-glutamate capsule biosynthesis protein CapA/YwtB (metallophosphatase superfamily)